MLPGPTIIRKCSSCGGFIKQSTIRSGNTFGATCWTDGKKITPMLPETPRLIKCRLCEGLIWLDEQEKVGEIDLRERDDNKFKGACPYIIPVFQDYLAKLEMGVSDEETEFYLRNRAWWAGNDERRREEPDKPMSGEEISNLRAFLALLDKEEHESQRLLKAEAMRELGMFEEAKALLSWSFSEEISQAVAIISELIEQKITSVREIKFK